MVAYIPTPPLLEAKFHKDCAERMVGYEGLRTRSVFGVKFHMVWIRSCEEHSVVRGAKSSVGFLV